MENKIIRKANHLIEASYKLSSVEQKIIAVLAASIKPTDENFKSYSIRIIDFQTSTGSSSHNYEQLEDVILRLKEKNLKIVYPDEHGRKTTLNISWISSSKHVEGSGYVELCFDPGLKPFLLHLKERFTNYHLKNVIQLRSQFSIRIYELLKQYEKIGQRLFSVDDLRLTLGVEEGQYRQYSDFKKKIILVAQKELSEKTDISFTFEEIKIGHGVGQVRFFIKSLKPDKALLNNPETISVTPVVDENLEKLVALLPTDYREKESIRNLLKKWLEKNGLDYVARNIEYANDGSNAINPTANVTKGSNYRVYLAKALAGDFGLPYKEDNEAKEKIKEEAKNKAKQEAISQKQRVDQTEKEKEDQERVRIFQESLSPEALENLRAEAISRLDPQNQELLRKKSVGSEFLLKITMEKICLERMKIP